MMLHRIWKREYPLNFLALPWCGLNMSPRMLFISMNAHHRFFHLGSRYPLLRWVLRVFSVLLLDLGRLLKGKCHDFDELSHRFSRACGGEPLA